MKKLIPLFLVAALCSQVNAGESATSRISDLNRAVQAKQRGADPYGEKPTAAQQGDAERKPDVTKLSDRIVFLTNGKMSVAIPKGALIHIPEKGEIAVRDRIEGRLVEWAEFIQNNSSIVRLEPVESDHLQGIKTIPEEAMERISKANFPTLTSYQGRVVALPKPR